MERLETQRKVKEVYMKFVENGKLLSIDGDRKKAEVEKDILEMVLDFLQNRNL
jgi:thymidylate kinase